MISIALSPSTLLKHMELPTFSNVFVLGCRERRVTFYDQQVRALNLIYSLFEQGRAKVGDEIVVIGGGVAGVTATAAAVHKGLRVTLLERRSQILKLQENCAKRWVHPHIYDWPDERAFEASARDIEVLSWTAARAEEVVREMRRKWEPILATGRVQFIAEAKDVTVDTNDRECVVTWNPGYINKRVTAVVLAVGFGMERGLGKIAHHSYWRDDKLDQDEDGDSPSYLISGVGDGGLTDVMRAAIGGFRHDEFLAEFALSNPGEPSLEILARKLLDTEVRAGQAATPQRASQILMKEYRQLDAYSAAIDERIAKLIRTDRKVSLNGSGEPLTLRASILNRYLVSRLIFKGHITYHGAKLDESSVAPRDSFYEVKIRGETKRFDRLIVRHGANPALQALGERIWNDSAVLENRNDLDESRVPMSGWYGKNWFGAPRSQSVQPEQATKPTGTKSGYPPATPVLLTVGSTDKRVGRLAVRIGAILTSHGVTVWPHEAQYERQAGEGEYVILRVRSGARSDGLPGIREHQRVGKTIDLLLGGAPSSEGEPDQIDFSDFEGGMARLLVVLRAPKAATPTASTSVQQLTLEILEDLEGETIFLPTVPQISILSTLRQLPRTGKQVRLEGYRHRRIPLRSIYDHLLSVAHAADCLKDEINHGVEQNEMAEVARCIAFHELNEVLLGDMPAYTELSKGKRRRTRLFAHDRLRSVLPMERERIANEFVAMFLNDKQRQSMQLVVERLAAGDDDPVARWFRFLDKLDPIVSVWRYLHQFRGRLDPQAATFLKMLKDFFENQDVQQRARKFDDRRARELVATLQNRENATQYYVNRNFAAQRNMFGIAPESFSKLVEGRTFLYASKT